MPLQGKVCVCVARGTLNVLWHQSHFEKQETKQK